jgi:hypothetical protein
LLKFKNWGPYSLKRRQKHLRKELASSSSIISVSIRAIFVPSVARTLVCYFLLILKMRAVLQLRQF